MSATREPKFRAIKASELPLLTRLWKASGLPFRPKGRDSLKNLQEQRRRDPQLFVGAFEGKRLIGAAIASDDGRKGWINRLAVAPGARGRGIGSLLIQQCEGILRSRGRLLICVHIEDYNTESMKVFENHGYKKEEGIFYFTKRESEEY